MGTIEVPIEALWGAQTQRSINNFSIGEELIPIELIYSLTLIKKAASIANYNLGLIDKRKKDLIVEACTEILDGLHDSQFPLKVWQTGSGTQTNMNVNEVISNIAALKTNSELGSHHPIHPNDDVNKSQSTNDTFPAAIQISVVNEIINNLVPTIRKVTKILDKKSEEVKKLEELIERQKFIKEDSFESINRNKDLIKMHSKWLDAHVELQPFELKKKFLENKLKVLVGENQVIKDICSWKRKKKKQITKNALLKFDSELAKKYISIGEPQIRFKVNDFRPYHFE